jgi:hypothetical protein
MFADWLSQNIYTLNYHLQASGCLELPDLTPRPDLRNPIHPIFHQLRWMRGYGQLPSQYYERITPSFRLASLMLTEDCMLPWWSRLCFGQRAYVDKKDGSDEKIVYIRSTKDEYSTHARREVKDLLTEMGNVITLMFTPQSYTKSHQGSSWGTTCSRRRDWPCSHHFRDADYPHVPTNYTRKGKCTPAITVHAQFCDFFSSESCNTYSSAQALRIHYMFATILVHEAAHAFYMFIGKASDGEPHWDKHEPKAELGYSWETNILGRVCNPLINMMLNSSPLMCVKTYTYDAWDQEQRDRIIKILLCEDAYSRMIPVPLELHTSKGLPPLEWRGNQFSCGDLRAQNKNYLCVVYGVPMQWVANWFQEKEWERRKREWKTKGTYKPPELGKSFVLLYEGRVDGFAEMCIVDRG